MEIAKAFRTLLSSSDSGLTSLSLEHRGSLESPNVPLNSPGAVSIALNGLGLGTPTAAGEVVTERNALENPTVYTCITLIAQGVAQIPFKVYQVAGGGRTEATNHSLSYLCTTSPNADMTAFTFFECISGCAVITGNGYAEIERDDHGSPLALWPLNPMKTEPKRDPATGLLFYVTSDGEPNGSLRRIEAAEMLHIKGFSVDGLKGLSPIALQRQEIGFANATLKAGARVLGNGMQPTGLLLAKDGVNAAQSQQVRETMEQQASGANRGRTAVLPTGFDYKQLSMTMADAEFVALRNMSRAQIAALFHVDPHFCGDTTRQATANHEQATLSLIQETLQPWMTKIEQEFRRKLLPPTGRVPSAYSFGFDLSARLRTDLKTTLDAIGVARQWTVLTVDEGRAMLGYNPIGGDVGKMLLSPVNCLSADIAVDWNPQKPSPGPAPKEPNPNA